MPRSVNGDEWLFRIGFIDLPVFRENVKPRLVGNRSHGATFLTILGSLQYYYCHIETNPYLKINCNHKNTKSNVSQEKNTGVSRVFIRIQSRAENRPECLG